MQNLTLFFLHHGTAQTKQICGLDVAYDNQL